MIGTTVSHYRVVEQLGQGGMGVVYAAEDEVLGRRVALKFCRTFGDPQRRARLLEEAKAASSLVHPNIAQIYQFGATGDGEPFIVMELVPGASLTDMLRDGPLPQAEALRIVEAVARALREAHAAGIVHRDIKPSNIRMTESGEVKVLDFGLARTHRGDTLTADLSDATRTLEGRIKGTPAYMSPEQARGGPVDRRADLFSMGAVFYECLTGRSPFAGETQTDSLAKVIESTPAPPSAVNPAVNPALDAVTLKLLAKRAEDRYQSADEFLAALARLGSRFSVLRTRRARRGMAAGGALLAAACALALWSYLRGPAAPPPEAERWYREGSAAMADGTFSKAARLLERATSAAPGYTMAHAQLAEAWEELEEDERAQRELLAAMPPGLNPRLSGPDNTHLRAIHAAVTRDFPAAARLYQELAAQSQGSERVAALLALGRVWERAERTGDALDAYLAATRADPESAAAFLHAGAVYLRRRDRQNARIALDRAESLYRAASNQEGLTECVYQRARLETNTGESLRLLDQALAQAEVARNSQQIVKIRLLMSDRFLWSGEGAKAVEQAQLAVGQAESSGLENLLARGLIDVGNSLFVRGDSQAARNYVQRALEIAQREGAKPVEARALATLGNHAIEAGKPREGIPLVEQALRFYRAGNYRAPTVRSLVILGRAKRNLGDSAGAEAAFREAVEATGPAEASAELAYAQEGLASVMAAQERYPDALARFAEVRSTYEKVHHSPGVLAALANTARIAALLGRDGEAASLLNQARAAAAAQGASRIARATVHNAAAEFGIYAGRYPLARAEAAALLEILGEDEPSDSCRARIVSGLALARSGRAREGERECRRARQDAARLDDAALAAAASIAWAECASAAGNTRAVRAVLRPVAERLEAARMYESAWRAWAWLGLALSGPERAAALERARASLAKLRASWPAEYVMSYSGRADVRKLIDRI